jgi:hypothetical protein
LSGFAIEMAISRVARMDQSELRATAFCATSRHAMIVLARIALSQTDCIVMV